MDLWDVVPSTQASLSGQCSAPEGQADSWWKGGQGSLSPLARDTNSSNGPSHSQHKHDCLAHTDSHRKKSRPDSAGQTLFNDCPWGHGVRPVICLTPVSGRFWEFGFSGVGPATPFPSTA